MNITIPQLYDFVNPAFPDAVLTEVLLIASDLKLNEATRIIPAIHHDIVSLFDGRFDGYRGSNTKYHDLEHTLSVVLCTARLMHGCAMDNGQGELRPFLLGIISAYYHDVGLIQTKDDNEGTGAKYTVGHEGRSIAFMREHLSKAGLDEQDQSDIADMIRCTILAASPDEIDFSSKQVGHAGRIMGTADLLAQLADRNYLEKLLLLFKEFEEARLPGYGSELELLRKTEAFYTHVAKPRLEGPLGNLQGCMTKHFTRRWNTKHDLYAESIERNMTHLAILLEECGESYECLLNKLNRAGIAELELLRLDQ
ncbi:MAG: HD domain-containing protein [Proteobacteria bacterium]|nr:HD domain-containing protein [Pseudomonadota bacterium]